MLGRACVQLNVTRVVAPVCIFGAIMIITINVITMIIMIIMIIVDVVPDFGKNYPNCLVNPTAVCITKLPTMNEFCDIIHSQIVLYLYI